MKSLLLLLLVLVSPGGALEIEPLIQQLPATRLKALADTAKLRAGSTAELVDAAATMRKRLLPMIVTLESKLEGKWERSVRAQLERDLEAVARDAHIRGHAHGWGGSAVAVDAAWAVVEHLEARASWCVWQLMKDSETFDFDLWLTQWNAEGEQNGARPTSRSESDSRGDDQPQAESEKRSR